MKETVLIYIEKDNQYLLIHKVKKDMNQNKYMGVGGKIEDNETPYQAAIRETYEETGLTVKPIFKADIYFHSNDYDEKMYLYKVLNFYGDIKESDEGKLVWVNKFRLKDLPMWEGDYYFLDKIDSVDTFEMHLYYDGEKLIKVL